MKPKIHPKYYEDSVVTCACGESWTVGSTLPEIKVDLCSNCHPFYTGEQRIVDTEGQVERFYQRLEVRQKHVQEKEEKEAERTSPDRDIAEFGLGKRANDSLIESGLTNAGEFMAKLAEGDQAILDIDGFGRKSLADIKKAMRRFGYDLPETE
jgi:large subunit ribosomal protein L31